MKRLKSISLSRIILVVITILLSIIAITLITCNAIVANNARGKAFDEIDSLKWSKVGLLLGTTPQTRIGNRTNMFFKYRIDATVELYKARKISYILISGDENSLDGVNEVECMRDSLVARGIPEYVIFLDGKGFRTLDSVVRACEVYRVFSFTIISQRFHNERALYLAEHLGLDVDDLQAYNAKDPSSVISIMTYIREYLARVKMFLDIWTGKQPVSLDKHAKELDTIPQMEQIESAEYYEALCADSFIIKYSNAVNDYKVKAVAKINLSEESPVLCADIYFTKNGISFMLHSMSFGDSIFCTGRMDPDGFNLSTFEKYRGKTIDASYVNKDNGEKTMLMDVPFFFKDLDFDDVPELVIVHKGMAVRFGDGYDVYRIVEGKPFLIDYPPYNQNKEEWGFGMTDYPRFNFKEKIICCPYPEGEISYEGYTTYGISKTEKDAVFVNGRKHYFNKIVKINR